MHHLGEWQWLRGGATLPTHTLLHQRHGEALVWDAVPRVAHVLRFAARHVEVDPQQDIFKALSGVIHESQLKALLVVESLGQGAAEGIGRQSGLMAVL